MDNLEEKTLKREKLYSGKVVDLFLDEVELPNGKKGKREIIKHPGAVAVIALTHDQKIVMVQQYRKALERTIVEIPAGKLEKNEDPKEAALRELEEETGYTADSLQKVTSFYTSPGFADELIHLYIAENIKPLEEKKELDEDEFVNVMLVSLEEAKKLTESQEIYDAKTAYAVLYLQLLHASSGGNKDDLEA
jgi:ADP-ribose pyrophosphatase